MRFLTAILASAFAASAWAAPPALTLPPEIPGEPVAFVEVRAKTDGKWVRYVTLDAGLAVFPSSLLSDKTVTVVVAAKPGRYRILAYTGNDDGGAEAITTLVIGGATQPPPDKPVDPPPPDKPPPATKGYFLIVRPDGPASPDFTAVLANPAWDELRKAGHAVKEKTLAETVPIYKPPAGTTLPFVVTLSQTSPSKVLAGPVELPTTADGIRELAKGVK